MMRLWFGLKTLFFLIIAPMTAQSEAVNKDFWRAWAVSHGKESHLTVEGIYENGGLGLVAQLKPAVHQGKNPKVLILELELTRLPGIWPAAIQPIPASYVLRPYQFKTFATVEIRYPDKSLVSRTIFDAGGTTQVSMFDSLLKDRRQSVLDAVTNSEAFRLLSTEKRVVLSGIDLISQPSDTDSRPLIAEVLHFNYGDGKTIRTIVEVASLKVMKLETLEAFPTPLADEEIFSARMIAVENDERVKAMVSEFGEDRVVVDTLAPVVSDKNNPRYGKRIAILIYAHPENARSSVTVTVNLTDRLVIKNGEERR